MKVDRDDPTELYEQVLRRSVGDRRIEKLSTEDF
jgi:hypothetical protein